MGPLHPLGAQTEAQASEGGSCLVSGAQASPGRLDGAEKPLQAGDPRKSQCCSSNPKTVWKQNSFLEDAHLFFKAISFQMIR